MTCVREKTPWIEMAIPHIFEPNFKRTARLICVLQDGNCPEIYFLDCENDA